MGRIGKFSKKQKLETEEIKKSELTFFLANKDQEKQGAGKKFKYKKISMVE